METVQTMMPLLFCQFRLTSPTVHLLMSDILSLAQQNHEPPDNSYFTLQWRYLKLIVEQLET